MKTINFTCSIDFVDNDYLQGNHLAEEITCYLNQFHAGSKVKKWHVDDHFLKSGVELENVNSEWYDDNGDIKHD